MHSLTDDESRRAAVARQRNIASSVLVLESRLLMRSYDGFLKAGGHRGRRDD